MVAVVPEDLTAGDRTGVEHAVVRRECLDLGAVTQPAEVVPARAARVPSDDLAVWPRAEVENSVEAIQRVDLVALLLATQGIAQVGPGAAVEGPDRGRIEGREQE